VRKDLTDLQSVSSTKDSEDGDADDVSPPISGGSRRQMEDDCPWYNVEK